MTQPERVSGTLASKKGHQGQPGCALEAWPAGTGALANLALPAPGLELL